MQSIKIQGVEFLTNDMAYPYHGLDRDGILIGTRGHSINSMTNNKSILCCGSGVDQYRVCTRHLPIFSSQLYHLGLKLQLQTH